METRGRCLLCHRDRSPREKRKSAECKERERKGSMIDRFCFLAPKCRRRQGLHTWLSPVSGKQSGFISWGGSLYNVGDYGSPFSTQLALLLINFALSLYRAGPVFGPSFSRDVRGRCPSVCFRPFLRIETLPRSQPKTVSGEDSIVASQNT